MRTSPLRIEHHRHRHKRERERATFPNLAVALTGSLRWRVELDRGDQLAGLQHRVALGLVARQPVQAGDRDRPRAVPAVHVHRRLERGQRHRHVGRMGGHAQLGMAEDRVVGVPPLDGGAPAPRPALVARLGHVGEVRAARALEQVAADRGEVAQLTRRAVQHRLREDRIPVPHARVGRQVAVGHRRADTQPAARPSPRCCRDRGGVRRRSSTRGVSTSSRIRSTRLVPPPR